ncbi:hypothetical protein [Alsobacter sp. R-9]
MGDVIAFRPPAVRPDGEVSGSYAVGAEILFFTGVRYERAAEPTSATPRRARPPRKPRARA